MKKRTLLSVLTGFVLMAGMVLAHANSAYAGDTAGGEWAAFMKQIDPSSAVATVQEPLCQRVLAANNAVSDWDAFLTSIDPGHKADINTAMACTATANMTKSPKSETTWDTFMNFMDPSRLQYARR